MEKILIVDDDKIIRELISELVLSEFSNASITEAEDGLIAQVKCLEEKYDMVILDHMMPNLDGATFLDTLRKSTNINKDTPIIMLTAFMPNISSDHKVNDRTLYLKKPIDFEKMIRFLRMSI
jgi:CheY-like chemotaxis protein